MTEREILFDFSVEGVPYRLAFSSELELYLRRTDRFGVKYCEAVTYSAYPGVLAAMGTDSTHSMLSRGDWPAKWKSISTQLGNSRYVLLGPASAVEIYSGKARALRKAPATQEFMEQMTARWIVEPGFGTYRWYLDVIRMILEAP